MRWFIDITLWCRSQKRMETAPPLRIPHVRSEGRDQDQYRHGQPAVHFVRVRAGSYSINIYRNIWILWLVAQYLSRRDADAIWRWRAGRLVYDQLAENRTLWSEISFQLDVKSPFRWFDWISWIDFLKGLYARYHTSWWRYRYRCIDLLILTHVICQRLITG